MKKTAIITLIASLLILTGCQDPIFEAIRQDVKPEDPTVSGNVGSITRYTAGNQEFLFLAADNGLRYKHKDNSSHGAWNSYSIPFSLHSYDFNTSSHSGEQIISVLANSTTLYIISAVYSHTSAEGLSYPSNIKLYGKNITANGTSISSEGDWTLITENNNSLFPITINENNYYESNFEAFQTNAPMNAHRKAFIRAYDSENKVYHYYELNGLSAPSEFSLTASTIIDAEPSTDSGYVPVARSAVYFDGGIKYFTSSVATTNETYTSEASHYYYTNRNNKLYYSNGNGSPLNLAANSSYAISALATCADSILIGYGNISNGSAGGIDRATLTNGEPVKLAPFSTNAQFQITRDYIVLTLLNASPEKTETESNLYAAITFSGSSLNFNNIGLWSYYPGRGNWNRE